MSGRLWLTVALAPFAVASSFEQAAAQGTSVSNPRIVKTLFRRSPTRDFVPERSFIVNRGDKLHAYQLKFEFSPQPRTPVDFQTFNCVARNASNKGFQFSYRNQTVSAISKESETYFLIVPIPDLQVATCQVATR